MFFFLLVLIALSLTCVLEMGLNALRQINFQELEEEDYEALSPEKQRLYDQTVLKWRSIQTGLKRIEASINAMQPKRTSLHHTLCPLVRED